MVPDPSVMQTMETLRRTLRRAGRKIESQKDQMLVLRALMRRLLEAIEPPALVISTQRVEYANHAA